MNNLLQLAKQRLSALELKIFRLIFPRQGVVMIKGRPGTAKSALLRSIAEKLDMTFIDLRLPTMDETDLGVFPSLKQQEGYDVLRHAVPEWAEMTTQKNPDGSIRNFLIVFEELNRAERPQRNAALGLLNERIIGHNFKFGSHVFMAATGNIGTEDGTDVEEFDTALKSRLITFTHDLQYTDWKELFANENVHPDVIRYLDQHPTDFYPALDQQGDNLDVITNPRTWTFLSTALIENFGKDSTIDEYGEFLRTAGQLYVGTRAQRFAKFLEENKRVRLSDVLEGKVKKFDKISRDNRSEILEELVAIDILGIEKKTFKNVIEFLKTFRGSDSDLLTGKIYDWIVRTKTTHVTDKPEETDRKIIAHANVKTLLDEFKPEMLHARKNYTTEKK